LPGFSAGTSNPTSWGMGANTHGTMVFASVTQSEDIQITCEPPLFLPADHIQVGEFAPGRSIASFENMKDKDDLAGYESF